MIFDPHDRFSCIDRRGGAGSAVLLTDGVALRHGNQPALCGTEARLAAAASPVMAAVQGAR